MTAAASPLPPEDPDDRLQEGQMGFLDHLDELRTRIIRSLIAVGGGMLVAFFFVDQIGYFILSPTLRVLPPGDTLIYTRAGEGLSFTLDIALIGGLVLASPFVMYQVWRFIAPGLYAKEKRYAIPFVVLTTAGSLGGALFTHYVMFPATIAFLGTFNPRLMRFMPRVEDTFELYKNMMIGMVVVFQMPTLVFFLAKMRLVTARFLVRNFKYAILLIFVAAAFLTSTADPWNQSVYAAPMLALYLISIVIAWFVGPKAEKAKPGRVDAGHLRLVIAASVVDHAWRHRKRQAADFPRGISR